MFAFVLDQPLLFLAPGVLLPIIAFFIRKKWKPVSRAFVAVGLICLVLVGFVWGRFALGMLRLTYFPAEDPEEQNVVLQIAQQKLVEKFGPDELLNRPFQARLDGQVWIVRGMPPLNSGKASGVVTLKKGSHDIISVEHEP